MEVKSSRYSQESYEITGEEVSHIDPALEYTVHKLEMTARIDMSYSSTFVPSPQVNERLSWSFQLPVEKNIL
jgi:hypothetical protein